MIIEKQRILMSRHQFGFLPRVNFLNDGISFNFFFLRRGLEVLPSSLLEKAGGRKSFHSGGQGIPDAQRKCCGFEENLIHKIQFWFPIYTQINRQIGESIIQSNYSH